MLKLLTKFKTQSLNEVKPYENDGSFVSFCGEVRNSDDGVSDHSWPQDVPDELNGGPKNNQTSLSSTCFISRLPNELVRTYQLPTEVSFDKAAGLECENKENGDERTRENRQTGATGLSAAEKRKWSEVKNSLSSSFQQGNDSSSSDEEVKELFSKQHCGGNLKENRQLKAGRSGKVRPCDRKRHRFTSEEYRMYSRPSLDFEKMQQKMFWKKRSYASSHGRIVKVQSFSGHPHNLLPHPSVMSFKPIQVIQAFKLTPVEEPRALAF